MDLDTLAGMIKNGFDSVDEQLTDIRTDVSGLKTDISGLKTDVSQIKHTMNDFSSRLRSVERDVAYIHDHMVFQDPFEDLSARVKFIEEKLDIDSGK